MNVPIRAAVVTVSDSRTTKNDHSGGRLFQLLELLGAEVVKRELVADDLLGLRNTIYKLTEEGEINLIMTTGGTGLGPRDNTPEATQSIIEREVPGMAEAMRALTLKDTPMAMLSRGICGVGGRTLIINLPGSVTGVEQCFEVIRPVIQHAVNQVCGETGH
jgi:molybdopterin adenylyltransferase